MSKMASCPVFIQSLGKKKGAMAFEISSPAETDQPAIVTPGEKFAFLLTEMISPSRKKKKNPTGTSSVN